MGQMSLATLLCVCSYSTISALEVEARTVMHSGLISYENKRDLIVFIVHTVDV